MIGTGSQTISEDENFCVYKNIDDEIYTNVELKNYDLTLYDHDIKENEIVIANNYTTEYICNDEHDHLLRKKTYIMYIIYESPEYNKKYGDSFNFQNLLESIIFKTKEDKKIVYTIFDEIINFDQSNEFLESEHIPFIYNGRKYWKWCIFK